MISLMRCMMRRPRDWHTNSIFRNCPDRSTYRQTDPSKEKKKEDICLSTFALSVGEHHVVDGQQEREDLLPGFRLENWTFCGYALHSTQHPVAEKRLPRRDVRRQLFLRSRREQVVEMP